jgi:hypothetical protein
MLRGSGGLGRRGHDRGQKAWMKPELAIEPDMLGALGEGEEPGMTRAPGLELVGHRGDKALADPGVPQIGPGR